MEYIIEKIGMSRTVDVPSVPVTLLKVVEAKVCEVREDGKALVAYNSSKKLNKSIEGQQTKFGVSKEFNKFMTIEVAEGTEAGDLSTAALTEATSVKTSLNTKGRGFQGGMKRHGFSGGPAEHGHRFGRRIGSIGNAEWPGRVQPGKKMPGQYGNTQVTVKNDVLSFDAQNGILVLKGSIPGHNGARGLVRIVK
ncbi:MAG TPA: 50S ribosomal protein L3 [Sulfurovum sp.]|jgi:large subunit ribosomal protein L3|nr:MAG: 50S ribosomal protein L3 [Sulfurovum sp. 35-42-20]OYZ24443.1 MAG: 50S ribosomal protein L3 [Sulfurovum sp. 16-42-52]OYZ48358.1 MAG: 50S ribosomal protein L3 [Sulfurovum sp. 24-42-9]OZA44244.1 MAG: 50S ribosomal protein L3 [Sulfurovum sp. 17-42-90]OZA61195.1 MAG: 50S ribosomal protein L3 [Sulfurovum sp. 39-42-12]HQR73021.1 50S ribosomal protein L3 [Sulfurovum sp.]